MPLRQQFFSGEKGTISGDFTILFGFWDSSFNIDAIVGWDEGGWAYCPPVCRLHSVVSFAHNLSLCYLLNVDIQMAKPSSTRPKLGSRTASDFAGSKKGLLGWDAPTSGTWSRCHWAVSLPGVWYRSPIKHARKGQQVEIQRMQKFWIRNALVAIWGKLFRTVAKDRNDFFQTFCRKFAMNPAMK